MEEAIDSEILESDQTNSESINNTAPFIKLINSNKIEIKYIYHLSDIHIRNTQRHDEYKEIFERTYQKIKSQTIPTQKIH